MRTMAKKFHRYAQQGIGLLELMLSLAIIALLLVMATRYYSSAHGSQQLNAAVEAYHAIYAAAETYEANDPAGSPVLSDLVSTNLLPQVFGNSGKLANPWGGTITLTVSAASGGAAQSIFISMTAVPGTQCNALIASLAQTLSGVDKVGVGDSASSLSTLSDIKKALSADPPTPVCTPAGGTVGVVYYN